MTTSEATVERTPTTWELTRHAVPVAMTQLPAHAPVPGWALDDTHETPFWSVTRTATELSIISAYEALPTSVPAAGPFVAFSVDGPLDLSLVGVLAGLLGPLAEAEISILAGSTFDTDWVLVPLDQADHTVAVWTAAGHQVQTEEET